VQWRQAVALYERALSQQVDHPLALFGLARYYVENDEVNKAIELYVGSTFLGQLQEARSKPKRTGRMETGAPAQDATVRSAPSHGSLPHYARKAVSQGQRHSARHRPLPLGAAVRLPADINPFSIFLPIAHGRWVMSSVGCVTSLNPHSTIAAKALEAIEAAMNPTETANLDQSDVQ